MQLGKYNRFALNKNLGLDSEFEECIVDAENRAEIEACSDSAPVSSSRGPDLFAQALSFLNQFMPKPPLDYDKEECVVYAESFAELQEC